MTLNQLTYNILNIFRSGFTSDDEPISDLQVAFWIGYYRALFVKRDIENRKKLSRILFQDLGCIPLIPVDKAECCEAEWGCDILRTEKEIPNMIVQEFVGLIDKQTPLNFTTSVQSTWTQYSKYIGNKPRAFWRNNYIYVVNAPRLKYISVRGIFSDPVAAGEFVDCDGKPCYTPDSEYPMPEEMAPLITDMILGKEGRFILTTHTDETNDGPKPPIKTA